MLKTFQEYLNVGPELIEKTLISLCIVVSLIFIKWAILYIAQKNTDDARHHHHLRRITRYLFIIIGIILIVKVWINGYNSLSTFLGLLSAGIAIAMHDSVANIVGWIFIVWRKPFEIGERIEIGETKGDVIDIRLFQFSMIEIGNWVDAQQSTGRIIHVPNSKVLRETVANYEAGFKFIWHEIPVLITFESDWKKAKTLLEEIINDPNFNQSDYAKKQILQSSKKYFIFYSKLTPIVYTTVRDSGVLLTIRYISRVRQIRSAEQAIWEEILDRYSSEPDIDLAYPTTRFYSIPSDSGPPENTTEPA